MTDDRFAHLDDDDLDEAEPLELDDLDLDDEEPLAAAGILAGTDGPVSVKGGPITRFNPPARGAGTNQPRYDWPAIKLRYVQGYPKPDDPSLTHWPSLDETADYFGVSRTRCAEMSSRQGWVAERKAWQKQVENTQRTARAAALAKRAVKVDDITLESVEKGLQLCHAALQDVAVRAQRLRNARGAEGTSAIIDALEVSRLGMAVDLFHKIGLRAVGDPETHRIELTGVNGAPIEIAQELRRDDPTRLAGVLAVLSQAGLGDLFGSDGDGPLEARLGDDGVYETESPGA